MRTTLIIDDDILMAAKSVALNHSISIGRALSDIARKGLMNFSKKKKRNGLPLFSVPRNAHPITPEAVKKVEDEL